jgi:F-type H+-transporting ATPase subunit epsilon
MATLRLDIVTPEKRAYSEDVDMVVIPAAEGEMGVLPAHVPMVTQLLAGPVRITKGGQTSELLCGSGFAEITQTHVAILTDMAMEDVDIDEGAAEEAMQRAQTALKERADDPDAREDWEAQLRRSMAQVQYKRRRRGQAAG